MQINICLGVEGRIGYIKNFFEYAMNQLGRKTDITGGMLLH
jgi:hypothetical protein